MNVKELVEQARIRLPKPEQVAEDTYTVCLNIDANNTGIITDYYIDFEKESREPNGWRYTSHRPITFYPEN